MSMMIIFKCPTTGHDVNSGVITDPQSFDTLPHNTLTLRCHECGDVHEWRLGDGQLNFSYDVPRWPVPVRIA